jgi:hypothetical protein
VLFRSGDQVIVAVSGLTEGARVIAGSADALREGTQVRMTSPGAAKPASPTAPTASAAGTAQGAR